MAKYPRDLARAKQLLAESGYKGETLRLLPLPYGETRQRSAEMVRQNPQQAGIKIEMTPTDVAGWGERLNKWDYDLAFTYVYQYGDPALGVARNYTSDNIAQGSPFNNVEGYRNAKVDALFHAGAREMDPCQARRHLPAGAEDPARRDAGGVDARAQLPHPVPQPRQQPDQLRHRPQRQPGPGLAGLRPAPYAGATPCNARNASWAA